LYRDLIGKKFKYDGRGPDTFDCYGLCIEIYKRLGRELPEFISARNPKGIDITVNENMGLFERLKKPEPFCLVTLSVYKPYVSHIGVVLEDCTRFINIIQKRHVCIEYLNSERWKNRIDGYWKYAKN